MLLDRLFTIIQVFGKIVVLRGDLLEIIKYLKYCLYYCYDNIFLCVDLQESKIAIDYA